MTIEKFQTAFPDWRDESQYPDPKQVSLIQWAWEFLRRNQSYQTEYAALDLETDLDVRDRKSLQTGLIYGLNGSMIDPCIPSSELSGPIFQNATPRIIKASARPFQIGKFEVAVIINLRAPIDAQLKLIGPYLCDEQLRLSREMSQEADVTSSGNLYKRAQPEKYLAYLRVLDAKRANEITFRQIADRVFPTLTDSYDPSAGCKLAGTAYKAAVALRDGNYRFLPMFSNPEIDE